MWSLGVILYVLLVGYPPFFGNNKQEVFSKIEMAQYQMNSSDWMKISNNAKDLVKKLLERDPKKRIKPSQALNHAWFLDSNRRKSTTVNMENQNVDPKIMSMLKNFRSGSTFKNEVMKVLVNQLNEKEIQSLKDAFQAIDTVIFQSVFSSEDRP